MPNYVYNHSETLDIEISNNAAFKQDKVHNACRELVNKTFKSLRIPSKPLNTISSEKQYYNKYCQNDNTLFFDTLDIVKYIIYVVNEEKTHNVYPLKDFLVEHVHEVIFSVINKELSFTNIKNIENVDIYTFEHSLDVCTLSILIGKCMNLKDEDLTTLGIGAFLHDIGKTQISSRILSKPYNLTPEEFEKIKLHPVYGYKILNEILDEPYQTAKEISSIILHHHEKWDGTGYPQGLREEQIDLFSRIVTIADIFDAIISDRVYKTAAPAYEARRYLIDNASTIVDPRIINLCKDFLNDNYKKIFSKKESCPTFSF